MSPTYEFVCDNCGYHETSYRSIKTPKVTKCPSCGDDKLVRCISGGAGFSISGGGVYKSGFVGNEKKED
jgi:putative FmdB family regulatory protein